MYRARIELSVRRLGKKASDARIISLCKKEQLVWVSKDVTAAREPEIVRQLQSEGVSALWLRDEGKRKLKKKDLLWVAARDIDRVIEIVELSGKPVYLVSQQSRRSRQVKLPIKKRRRPRPAHTQVRKPKRKDIPGAARLFGDES